MNKISDQIRELRNDLVEATMGGRSSAIGVLRDEKTIYGIDTSSLRTWFYKTILGEEQEMVSTQISYGKLDTQGLREFDHLLACLVEAESKSDRYLLAKAFTETVS